MRSLHHERHSEQNLDTVFLSYSHPDQQYLNSLKRHFKAFAGRIDFWDDSRIPSGALWKEEIEKVLNKAKIAILFISADFFNSEFIMENELPALLNRAETNGTVILSVILKPCLFHHFPEISRYQAINSPSKAIIRMSEAEREDIWVKLLLRIDALLNPPEAGEMDNQSAHQSFTRNILIDDVSGDRL